MHSLNAERLFEVAYQENGQQNACDERILEDLLNARTALQYISTIHDAEADTAPVVVMVSDAELQALPQLILRDGESGGVLM